MAFRGESDPVAPHGAWASEVSTALSASSFRHIDWIAETGSTNDDLIASAARGAPHGSVLVADHQTAGRGRRDRTWVTAPGDALLVSILLRRGFSPDAPGRVTAAVAVAAAEACDELGYPGVGLKWPNDLVVGEAGSHRKLAGILAQSQVVGGDMVVVVGMGLNLVSARLGALAPAAIALDEIAAPPDRITLLTALLLRLDGLLATDGTAESLWRRYRETSATLGTQVRVELDDGVLEGEAVDLGNDGSLIVQTGGQRREIVVADVVSLR